MTCIFFSCDQSILKPIILLVLYILPNAYYLRKYIQNMLFCKPNNKTYIIWYPIISRTFFSLCIQKFNLKVSRYVYVNLHQILFFFIYIMKEKCLLKTRFCLFFSFLLMSFSIYLALVNSPWVR